ncbi:hypothetical protein [Clostridium sp.]|uniref:hypothetical protein n=1 Tax=Clostridium sp. TaxID=1506 RepID=UPI0025B85264|nr:hypothetical protein [Clostridium sp.]
MYEILFETNQVHRNIKDWNDKLFNDFHKKLNSIHYKYKTISKTFERLDFIINGYNEIINNKDSFFTLYDEEYGHKELPIKLYGIPQGYIDIENTLLEAQKTGVIKIKLSDFYDTRQNTKDLKNGYLIIKYIAT